MGQLTYPTPSIVVPTGYESESEVLHDLVFELPLKDKPQHKGDISIKKADAHLALLMEMLKDKPENMKLVAEEICYKNYFEHQKKSQHAIKALSIVQSLDPSVTFDVAKTVYQTNTWGMEKDLLMNIATSSVKQNPEKLITDENVKFFYALGTSDYDSRLCITGFEMLDFASRVKPDVTAKIADRYDSLKTKYNNWKDIPASAQVLKTELRSLNRESYGASAENTEFMNALIRTAIIDEQPNKWNAKKNYQEQMLRQFWHNADFAKSTRPSKRERPRTLRDFMEKTREKALATFAKLESI